MAQRDPDCHEFHAPKVKVMENITSRANPSEHEVKQTAFRNILLGEVE